MISSVAFCRASGVRLAGCAVARSALSRQSQQCSRFVNFGRRLYHRSPLRFKEVQGSWKPGMPGQPRPGEPPVPVGKNLAVGAFITCFVGGVYGYTVFQMRKQGEDDFLDEIEVGSNK